ncbi:sigma-70 family RNA polymerase sigma factor [Paenibacillus aurantius]|uniref:Sigma-70 family RNA polymerase sigma factor n=1 Tax=Paenibacillus aurantius TaxID=2918900 RepID=A0AA96LIM1_9BACL|nr:sigma-70 family RNA polymerase sigma factor [Paenibacillus aurantius]WNQ14029.1 sigma-70 family RNA polymerase sigma factor [Paenibacillus aurantius]
MEPFQVIYGLISGVKALMDQWNYLKHLAQGYDRGVVLHDLMDSFGNDVWNFAYFMTNRSDFADDLSQEVFLAAYNGLYAFRGDCSVKSWLLTITRNKALHYLQSAFIRKVILTDKFRNRGTSPAAEQVVFDRLGNRAVWKAVMQLPRKYKEVLVLDFHYGLKQKEIATLLKISEGTVKSRSHRAKIRMSKLLTREEV